jgi:hypothetical protein
MAHRLERINKIMANSYISPPCNFEVAETEIANPDKGVWPVVLAIVSFAAAIMSAGLVTMREDFELPTPKQTKRIVLDMTTGLSTPESLGLIVDPPEEKKKKKTTTRKPKQQQDTISSMAEEILVAAEEKKTAKKPAKKKVEKVEEPTPTAEPTAPATTTPDTTVKAARKRVSKTVGTETAKRAKKDDKPVEEPKPSDDEEQKPQTCPGMVAAIATGFAKDILNAVRTESVTC